MSTGEVIGLVGIILVMPTVYWGWHAHRRGKEEEKDRKSQRQAEKARLAKEEEQRERIRQVREERQRDLNRARFDVMLGSRDGRGRLQIKVVNRGPHPAKDIAVSLVIEGRVLPLGQAAALTENGQLIARADLGPIVGTYTVGNDRDEITHPAVSGELVVSFIDGNGSQTYRKRLNVGAGSRFEQRSITLTDSESL